MTPMIRPADLKTTVYRVGGYFEADGTPSPFDKDSIRGKNIPTALKGEKFAEVQNTPFYQRSNPLSFSLQADGKTKRLNFRRAGLTNNIVYLPYYPKNITSTEINIHDESVSYFITDELSGCNFFIDRLQNGNLVCYHANALQLSPTRAAVQANAGAFHPEAPEKMDEQRSIARIHYTGAKTMAELRVEEYYAQAQAAVKRKLDKGRTAVEFYGGTTVMGFREGKHWEFWFQTYARIPYIRPPVAGFLKGKEVTLATAKYRIIETKCFWRS